jgi:hypothetical protein
MLKKTFTFEASIKKNYVFATNILADNEDKRHKIINFFYAS